MSGKGIGKTAGNSGKNRLTRPGMYYIMYNCDVRRKCPYQSPGDGILRYMFSAMIKNPQMCGRFPPV